MDFYKKFQNKKIELNQKPSKITKKKLRPMLSSGIKLSNKIKKHGKIDLIYLLIRLAIFIIFQKLLKQLIT